ncbi:MAG: helix-turn-helix transcriptional regulator [Lachnospiraceae bacterium]|nr:helix-turn-helix transcriptional regulator [Lachnospiraceae bacterium]
MEQEKIGKFIAELRKEKGLTQKKLAQQLNITDKAISKWECGYSLPDNSVMVDLCDALGISVNELLSGERLSATEYSKKAEENIMTLIQENNARKKRSRRQFILSIIAVILLTVYFFWVINKSTQNGLKIGYFLDFIALNVDTILPLIMLILAGQLKPFINLFKYNIHKCKDADEVQKTKNATSFAIKSVLLSGGICSVIYFVNWMRRMDNVAYWGPNLALIIMGLFYSFIISGVLLILKERIS